MARKKKTEQTEQIGWEVLDNSELDKPFFTLPTQEVTEGSEVADTTELEASAELDTAGTYDHIEVKPGRVLLEEVGTGKQYPPFIIVNALKVKLHPDGTATVNGYIREGKSIIYKVKKKVTA